MEGSSANSTDVPAPSLHSKISSTPRTALYSCVFVYAVVAVIILLGNGLVIMSFCWRATLRTNINLFIVSLGVADGFVGMVSVPWWIYITLALHSGETWITIVHNIWIIFDIIGGVCSILHLVALSWDRLCAIVWPLNHRTFSSSKYLLLLSLIWVISLTVAILSLPGRKYALMEYNVTVIATCFFFPLLVICFTQAAIMYSVRQRKRYQSRRFGLRRNVRVAKTIGVMTGLFCLGWSPFFSLSLASYLNLTKHVPFWALHTVKFLQYSNSAVNPILYAHNFPHFRRAYGAMLRSCCWFTVWLPDRRPPQCDSNYTHTTTSSLYSSKFGQSANNRKSKPVTQFLHEARPSPTSYNKSFLLPTSFAAKEAEEKNLFYKTKQRPSAMTQAHFPSRPAITKFPDVSKAKMHETLMDSTKSQFRKISLDGFTTTKLVNQHEEFNDTKRHDNIVAEIEDIIEDSSDRLNDIVLRGKREMQPVQGVKDLTCTAEARLNSSLLTSYPDKKNTVLCRRMGSAKDLTNDQSCLAFKLLNRSKSVDFFAGLSKTKICMKLQSQREADIWV